MQISLPDPGALLSSLLSSMTRFSCLGCPEQALRIHQQLALLQSYPDDKISPLLKQVALRLETEWRALYGAIADEAMASDSLLVH